MSLHFLIYFSIQADFGELTLLNHIDHRDNSLIGQLCVGADTEDRRRGIHRHSIEQISELLLRNLLVTPVVEADSVNRERLEVFTLFGLRFSSFHGQVHFNRLLQERRGDHEDDKQGKGEVNQRSDVDLRQGGQPVFAMKFTSHKIKGGGRRLSVSGSLRFELDPVCCSAGEILQFDDRDLRLLQEVVVAED